MEGWIKLHRQTIDSRVFVNEGLLKVWVWCLLKANHSQQWVDIKTGRGSTEVEVFPGQFIFGRKSAAKKLKMKADTVYSRMKKLEKMQNINMQNNTHYSVVTIINWDSYQKKESDDQHQTQHPTNTQTPTNQQPNNTDKKDKKEKNGKNDKELTTAIENIIESEFISFWMVYDKKKDKDKCFKKWKKLTKDEKVFINQIVLSYVQSTPDPQFRKNPLTWLNGKCWEDEIVKSLNKADQRTLGNLNAAQEFINER